MTNPPSGPSIPTARVRQPQISTGAGIALAGIWFALTALTIFLLWWAFIFDPVHGKDGSTKVTVIGLLLCLLPLYLANSLPNKILGRK
jgi:uncharacterized membrane protein